MSIVRKNTGKEKLAPPIPLLMGGVAVFVIFSMVILLIETRYLRQATITLAENEAVYVGHHLTEKYFRPGIFIDEKGEFSIPPQLTEEMRSELATFGIILLKIYNSAGQIIASTDLYYVGMKKGTNPHFQSAIRGQVVGHLATKRYYRNLYGTPVSQDMLEIYVPVRLPGDYATTAVLEIYRPWAVYAPMVQGAVFRFAYTMAGLLFVLGFGLVIVYRWATGKILEEARTKARLSGALLLAGSTAHHMNQPLTALTLILEMLCERGEEWSRDLTPLLTEVDKIASIIKKISAITQVKTVTYREGIEIVDFEELKASSKSSTKSRSSS